MNILDIHAHPILGGVFPEDVDRCLKEALQFNVKQLCVMGNVSVFGENPTEKEVKTINDESIKVVNRYPENFIGFSFLNPNNDKNFIFEEAERCVLKEGFKGIKLWVSVKANNKKLSNIMEVASKYNIPVLQHTWYKAFGNRIGESNPADVAFLASCYPKNKIIMGHVGGCGIRGIIDISEFKNVYVETSGNQPETGVVEFAVKEIGSERILFGSDTPCRSFASQIARIYGAKISNKAKKMILKENAEKLLGLK